MVQLVAGEWGEALLLEYVFLEVVTVLRARRTLDVASEVGSSLLRAREITFVPCSDLFEEAFELFRRQGKRELSLVDSAIVVVARRDRSGFVATFDDDFRGLRGVTVLPS